MTNVNDAVILEPPEPADAAVIWLHGLGADGHDFEPIVPYLGMHNTRHIRFVFPHAPQIPVTINGGYVMRAWYDVVDVDLRRRADEKGVRGSEQILRDYVAQELAEGLDSKRIVVAGFSQGGAIALHMGLRYPKPLAGILALSTYLPLPEAVAVERHASNASVPIFLAHGQYDPVIPFEAGANSRTQLESLGYRVEWHSYPMPHAVSPDEITDIAVWLSTVLP
ncbi:MAG: alpha/beta fold hydrolase [Gammaproteobacteria bacterium]